MRPRLRFVQKLGRLLRRGRNVTPAFYACYPIKVFPDSNIILEGKPIADLPWSEIDLAGPILVLLSPTILDEVDSKKRDGRLAKHARAFNRLIGPIAQSGKPLTIRESGPRVDVALASCDRLPWEIYPDLDQDDGDSRLIVEALHARFVRPEEKVFVSHDIKPIAIATRNQLRAVHASDNWLRAPEPSAADKEAQRLRQRVAELTANEPAFEVTIRFIPDSAQPIYRVQSLTEAERVDMIDHILAKNPRPKQDNSPLGIVLYDSSLDKRYDVYADETVPTFVASLSTNLEVLYGQSRISVTVANTGTIQAERLVAEIEIMGGWVNDKFVVAPTGAPRAPVPKSDFAVPYFNPGPAHALLSRRSVGEHEVELVTRPKRSSMLVANCADFRHGSEWSFDGIVWMNPRDLDNLTISVRVTAANMRGECRETATIAKEVIDVHVSTLFDLSAGKIVKPFHWQDALFAAMAEGKTNAFEWPTGSGSG